MFNGKTHYKWQFSIAMLNYQRVNPIEMSHRTNCWDDSKMDLGIDFQTKPWCF
jgi:hypothetical protein